MRLIDADAFIKRFHNGNSDTKAQKLMNSTVRRMIREQPTPMMWTRLWSSWNTRKVFGITMK